MNSPCGMGNRELSEKGEKNTLKIYALADLHGKKDRIDRARTIIAEKQPDLLVLAGDITNYVQPEKTMRQLGRIPIPILCVTGNSDLWPAKKRLKGLDQVTLLDSFAHTVAGIPFAGMNGTIPFPFVSKIGFSERRQIKAMKRVITPGTVLTVHPPPRGILDRAGGKFSVGSFGIRQVLDKTQPLLLICGHVHEQAGYTWVNSTLVVNCAVNKDSFGAMIELEKNKIIKVEMII